MIVLIIEDEIEVTELWKRFLADFSEEVRIAYSPEDGLILMAQVPVPEIILLDLGFPRSHPLETLQIIPSLLAINPEATIIIVTGNNESSIKELSENLGANFFAKKPEHGSSQKALLSAIKTGLEDKTSKGPSFSQPLRILQTLTASFFPKPHDPATLG